MHSVRNQDLKLIESELQLCLSRDFHVFQDNPTPILLFSTSISVKCTLELYAMSFDKGR